MKSGIFTFVLLALALISVSLKAQPLHWSEDSPAGWAPLVFEEETDPAKVTEGSKSVKITFTETGTPYFVSDTFDIAALDFSFSIDVFDNDPGAEYNVRLLYHDINGVYINRESTDFTLDSPDFQTIALSGTAPENSARVVIAFRALDVAASWTGSSTFWLDKCIYSDGITPNLVPNPGFEEWPVITEFVAHWKEDSPAGWVPLTIAKETNPAKVTEGSNSVKITFTETGTPYFISDMFDIASLNFNFSIDVFDNDPGAEYSVRILFHDIDGIYINRVQSDFSLDNPDFQSITITGEAPENSAKAYIAIRLHDVAAGWTGASTVWFDNCIYSDGISPNLVPNFSFEDWIAKPVFLNYGFLGLDPVANGDINIVSNTIDLSVPFQVDVTALVATFEVTPGSVAKVGDVEQISGTTANDFTNPLVYSLSQGSATEDWTVTVAKLPASTAKDIYSFRFEGLTPAVNGVINSAAGTVALEVPFGTDLTALVPTIAVSEYASVSPGSGVAQNFTAPANYTVTAQDGSTQVWVVTVTTEQQGITTLFYEDFETLMTLPSGWIVINNDGYIQASGEERWQDSAWLVTTSNRIELQGTKLAMASSYCSNMPLEGKADDWMILPAISIGQNSTLSWSAMSTTSSGNYPDDYMVLCAPAVQGATPNIPYFEENALILANIMPENWSAFVGNPGQGLSQRSVNLKERGFQDQDVWIAFVLTTDLTPGNSTAGGSNLAVDNIKVVEGTIGINENDLVNLNATVFPNPANESINITFNIQGNGTASISIIDITGREVSNLNKSVFSGVNKISANVSGLAPGVYVVRTLVNNSLNVTKLMIH